MCPVLHLHALFITDQYQKNIEQAILVSKCCHCRINRITCNDSIYNHLKQVTTIQYIYPLFHRILNIQSNSDWDRFFRWQHFCISVPSAGFEPTHHNPLYFCVGSKMIQHTKIYSGIRHPSFPTPCDIWQKFMVPKYFC